MIDRKYFTGCSWETKDKQEPEFWSQVHWPGQKFVSFFQNIGGIDQSYKFSPANWLYSIFPSNDPWQNWSHSHKIAHSCGLHTLDNTSSMGIKIQRNEYFCSQMANLSVSSFSQHIILGIFWPMETGPLGQPGNRNESHLVFNAHLWRESRENAKACVYRVGSFPYRLNKGGVSGTKSNLMWSLFVISPKWHLDRNKCFQTKWRYYWHIDRDRHIDI